MRPTTTIAFVISLNFFSGMAAAQTPSPLFAPDADFPLGATPRIALDVDNDGDLDLFGPTGPLINDGSGRFVDGPPSTLFADFRFGAAGDFDGDGLADVVHQKTTTGNTFHFARNLGGGAFAAMAATTPVATLPAYELIAADLDLDGRADLIINNDIGGPGIPGLPSYWTCPASFTFVDATASLPSLFAPFSSIRMHAAVDMDADADLDLVVLMSGSSRGVRICTNDGVGGFTVGALRALEGVSPAVLADFDGDGDLDLACGAPAAAAFNPLRFVVSLNQGGGVFGPGVVTTNGNLGGMPWFAAADVDADGVAELIVGSLVVVDVTASGAVVQPPLQTIFTETPLGHEDFATNGLNADFDADGDLDVLAYGPDGILDIFRGNGAGLLVPGRTRLPAAFHAGTGVLVFDATGDGLADVVGAGPLGFFAHPGKSGFELSAITRIREIYATHGFRTVSGEGGRPFGLEQYAKALYVAWRYKHRAALGEANATLPALAAREGIAPRFAQHIWQVMNHPSLGYPSSEVASRWRNLPAPGADSQTSAEAVRASCAEIQKFSVTWPSWLFARGDVAAGGAGDESPLEFSDRTLNVKPRHHFAYVRGGGRGGVQPGPAKIYLNVAPVNPAMGDKPVILWRKLTVGFRPLAPRVQAQVGESVVVLAAEAEAAANLRRGILPPGERKTLRSLAGAETARRLNFGKSPDGTPIGPDDFASEGSVMFEVPLPEGPVSLNLQVDAELGSQRDQVVRIVISDRADGGTRGQPTRALVGDMNSAGYKAFRAGVMEFATLLPPNSHGEPTPADKDPVPDPFDNTYNVPEHDEFVQKIKYLRDDRFVVEHMLDTATRARLDQAWHDLYASFEYHDNYLRLLAKHFGYDLKGKGIAQMDKAQLAALPAELRQYVMPLRHEYDAVLAAQVAARPGQVKDCLEFASRAWRRPLTEKEKLSLRAFYDKTFSAEPDHRKAIQALLARILVAPQFLYRVEQVTDSTPVKSGSSNSAVKTDSQPLSNWELASRLSFFLWSSIPDDELRRAAGAGELSAAPGIARQVKRMLADPKARRLATEFFGQWLGFYHFDQHKGVDTSRFAEFTEDVKAAMYDEAVSFFEHLIRKDRPVSEILSADYTFLNQDLARFYGVKQAIKSTAQAELVEGADAFQRGGLLRLGAVLTATSAPLRTSPVKRGDWILRRVLGTPVPPPPADAGSLPADDKLFGGLSLKAKLEQHKRNASCANCHLRIDPLGFALEHYDPTGRWRAQYPDGKPIEDAAALADKTEIAGFAGLLKYLQSQEAQVRKTLASKLVGFALGRTVLAADQLLIERMVAAGGGATIAQLATEIASSKQFRQRQGRADKPATSTRIALNATAQQQGARK